MCAGRRAARDPRDAPRTKNRTPSPGPGHYDTQRRLEQRLEAKAEREQLAKEKEQVRVARLEFEQPLTNLLTELGFASAAAEEVAAPQLSAFIRANRDTLKEMGVDLSSSARKTVLPLILTKIAAVPASLECLRSSCRLPWRARQVDRMRRLRRLQRLPPRQPARQ